MSARILTLLLAVAVATCVPAPAAWAGHAAAHPTRYGRIVVADAGVSLDQAVAAAERRYQARVVRTEVRDEGGRTVYVLRLLSDSGRVWVVKVDAATGDMR